MNRIQTLSKWLKGAVGEKSAAPKPQGKPKHRHRSPKPVRHENREKQAILHEKVMRIIPVGGLEEVGKNCMIVEYERDIVVIDMGFQFPEDEMFGVDYVIPDIQYLIQRKKRIRGILITHGHLDHIGALPYVMEDLGFPPIYGSKLSIGLCKKQLEEHKLTKRCQFKEVNNKDVYHMGQLKVEFFKVNHSIPDSLGLVVRSPEGAIVHTGDFKFDFTPADGIEADIGKMSEIGKRGVNILFSDSTNAIKPGHTLSERVVGENLNRAIERVEGRIIIACFASLIGRIQQILDFAQTHNRKVFVSGGSMVRNIEIARELGFLKLPRGVMKDISEINHFPDNQVLILTTGSQGEPMAALSRMATDSHKNVNIRKGDTVVLSASPIIGNEQAVAFLMDGLSRLGANIVHNRIMDVHTSGHGQQEDLKMMMTLIKPQHLVPIHGNHFMRKAHGGLGPKVGIPEKHVHMMDNGNVIEIRKNRVEFKHEDIGVKFVVIDGLGQGDLGSVVQKEREAMAKNGVVNIILKMRKNQLVGRPVVHTNGFVYRKELEGIVKDIEKKAMEAIQKLNERDKKARLVDYQNVVRSAVSGFILKRLDRSPLVTPVVVNV